MEQKKISKMSASYKRDSFYSIFEKISIRIMPYESNAVSLELTPGTIDQPYSIYIYV